MFPIPSSSPILVGGSRALVSGSAFSAARVFSGMLQRAGHAVHVGCATGADQAVIGYQLSFGVASPLLRVFAAGSSSGAGFWRSSAFSFVSRYAALGGSVSWLAGGSLSVPLVARLMARSLAALAGCAAAVFFQPGPGSLKVARAALRQGIPVLVCKVGIPSAPVLPVPSVSVQWFGFSFWLYQPAIQSSF